MLNKVIVLPADEFNIWMQKKLNEMNKQDTSAVSKTNSEPLINK
jgi:heme/copper-type cytochrome/quinol oxidase subunit 2